MRKFDGMSPLFPHEVVQQAQQNATAAMQAVPHARLSFSLTDNGWYVVTSPDADWLIVTGKTQHSARLHAITALLKVAQWCGRPSRTSKG